jgi:prepilin-type N-terminal cleavage/methylation domain-containing protein
MQSLRSSSSRRAFTVVELLVVIGILVLLASIAIPMVMRSYRNAEASRVRMDLQTIATALDAYKQDHGDYPRSDGTGDYRGAITLARALVAPGPDNGTGADGASGPGFRTRRLPGVDPLDTSDDILQGKIYGPYLKAESFRLSSTPTNADAGLTDMAAPLLFDKARTVILYIPGKPTKPNLTAANAYVAFGGRPFYDFADVSGTAAGTTPMSLKQMQIFLGDSGATPDGGISGSEKARYTGPFILWCAGPDGLFGPDIAAAAPTGTLDAADVAACDDITNFNE